MLQSPMISSPLKQTNEIDWVLPLKGYIEQIFGDDPDRYAEECNTLNRLRQDMRGAGKDSAAGRDLLYRYYGQLELLDLRFPVDESHIKISFTWFDAFTQKATSQYSLAYEKASIIFNISAVLSCHAANQHRFEDIGLKTAYHSFQAAAGMFTYINENFLHAPSTDLSRDTIKVLIAIMLAQGQEVFLEKQVADGKKVGLLAKLASQATYLYGQAVEGIQDNVTRAVFDKFWLQVVQVKCYYMSSLAQHFQAQADAAANSHGIAIARLQVAEAQCKDACRIANAFPLSLPSTSNLSSETGSSLIDATKRHLANVQEKLTSFNKDNDFIYHQVIPTEASLGVIPKLPAAKAIPVSELYQGQDIQRIIGPDIFQKIIPMSVTESASLYDEEKAKLFRAEVETVETANGEMAASLDYLKLPASLSILKGGTDQGTTINEEFHLWCEELAGYESFRKTFDRLQSDRSDILGVLERAIKQLEMEESVCEKMRSKYGSDWTQQPSSRLTSTLRSDIRNYGDAVEAASLSDSQLLATARQNEPDFDEMRSAGEKGEADVLYQQAILGVGADRSRGKTGVSSPVSLGKENNLLDDDYGEGGVSVADQIVKVEDLLKRLNLIKRDRAQVLKDLKEKIHNDDISNVLILNKKSIASHENQLFQSELEKFRPHQNRLLQANHRQITLMKELTKLYGDLLQDRRVRSEQLRYESYTRQRNFVLSKYKKIFQAFNDLISGFKRAQRFYSGMKDTVDSLEKNVETFVNNRRSEGAKLLSHIERENAMNASGQADRERDRLRGLMERVSFGQTSSSPPTFSSHSVEVPRPSHVNHAFSSKPTPSPTNFPQPSDSNLQPPLLHATGAAYNHPPSPEDHRQNRNQSLPSQESSSAGAIHSVNDSYNPVEYTSQSTNSLPPQGEFSSRFSQLGSPQYSQNGQFLPQGYIPPPPPPGPPPNLHSGFRTAIHQYSSGPDTYNQYQTSLHGSGSSQNTQNDLWAGLSAWK